MLKSEWIRSPLLLVCKMYAGRMKPACQPSSRRVAVGEAGDLFRRQLDEDGIDRHGMPGLTQTAGDAGGRRARQKTALMTYLHPEDVTGAMDANLE
jgi:hypothetical protein